MGNEGPWWLVAGALILLLLATVVFIGVKIALLFVREWRKKRHD
jgi:membrane protein YdbS with pleckstrin-like domain